LPRLSIASSRPSPQLPLPLLSPSLLLPLLCPFLQSPVRRPTTYRPLPALTCPLPSRRCNVTNLLPATALLPIQSILLPTFKVATLLAFLAVCSVAPLTISSACALITPPPALLLHSTSTSLLTNPTFASAILLPVTCCPLLLAVLPLPSLSLSLPLLVSFRLATLLPAPRSLLRLYPLLALLPPSVIDCA
jgi:hypothetical protein